MKQLSLALTCMTIALVTIACTETTPTTTSTPSAATSPSAPAAPVDEFASTRANYAKHCVGCHGENADGGLVKVNDKQIKVPSFKARHAIQHTDEQLIRIVTNGVEEMPSFKEKLTEEEITELVRFIRREFQGK